MGDAAAIAFSYLILLIAICVIYGASKQEKLAEHDEFRIGLIGCAVFMHLSWLVVYMASINPFIQPEFKAPKAN